MKALPESFKDRDFLLDPSQWPKAIQNTPYVCLRRTSHPGNNVGFIMGIPKPNEQIRVLLGNIFNTDITLEEVHYDNVDSLLADGWTVD